MYSHSHDVTVKLRIYIIPSLVSSPLESYTLTPAEDGQAEVLAGTGFATNVDFS